MPPPDSPALHVSDVTVTFGGLRAVDGCSLEVPSGRITGLIGPNGAGKTTLFNVLTGLTPVARGEVRFFEERIDGLPPHRIHERGLVRTFQIPRPFVNLSVAENLMLWAPDQFGEAVWRGWMRPSRVASEERSNFEKAREILDMIGLDSMRSESAGSLSGGQKKLLELGRALMPNPRMILLDEPGAGVYPQLAESLLDEVQRISLERGIGFLIIEHDMARVSRYCSKVVVMARGQVLVEGRPDEVKQDERVMDSYLGVPMRNESD